jgi:hypothetical protein
MVWNSVNQSNAALLEFPEDPRRIRLVGVRVALVVLGISTWAGFGGGILLLSSRYQHRHVPPALLPAADIRPLSLTVLLSMSRAENFGSLYGMRRYRGSQATAAHMDPRFSSVLHLLCGYEPLNCWLQN